MKHCHKCNTNKPKTEFGKNKAKADGLQGECRSCRKIINNAHYANSLTRRETIRRNQKQAYIDSREFITNYKLENPCIVCQEKEPCTLDFHHLSEKDKSFTIASVIGSKSIKTLKTEIEKCVVLCANCHRKVHAGVITL